MWMHFMLAKVTAKITYMSRDQTSPLSRWRGCARFEGNMGIRYYDPLLSTSHLSPSFYFVMHPVFAIL